MAMSRKHYVAIAAALAGDQASASNNGERLKVRAITLSLADILQADSPRFNRARFYRAAGLTEHGSLSPVQWWRDHV